MKIFKRANELKMSHKTSGDDVIAGSSVTSLAGATSTPDADWSTRSTVVMETAETPALVDEWRAGGLGDDGFEGRSGSDVRTEERASESPAAPTSDWTLSNQSINQSIYSLINKHNIT